MNQVNLIKRGRIFLIVTAAILVGGFFIVWGQVKADLDDVVLNEVYVNSAGEWVEILNPSANAVNINGYKIVEGVGPTATVRTINHDVFAPAQGIVVISGSDVDSGTLNFLDTGDTVSLAKTDGVTIIGSVTYGIGTDLDADDPNKSLQFINSAWTVQAPTKGWFNGDPTISSIVANINAAGVTTNWGTVDIPDSSAATGLYFEKTGYGRVTFNATLNLTDSDTVTFLQDLGNKMDASAGSMKFDARTAAQLKDAGAEIQMYGLDALGFTSTPNLIVKDDNGVVVPTNDLNYPDLDMVDYTDGTLTFTTNHFTQFEVDNNIYVDASASGDKDGTQAHPYNTIQEGVNAAPIGGTVNVAAGIYEFSEQFNIAKPLSIVGQGEVIFKSVNASWSTINGYKHLLGIYAGTMENPVSISNIIFDADGKSHAINTYNNAYGILENVTVKNGKGAGIIVNGSTINATNLNTSGNAWGAVNVDPGLGVTTPSIFTLNSGALEENTQIWSDGANVSETATVTVSADGYNKYSIYGQGDNFFVWKNRELTDTASITKNSKTTLYTTIQSAIDDASAGDTIIVSGGTYDYESEGEPAPKGLIKVTKGVTIKAADGVRPIIDGSGFDGVFKIHPSALLPGSTVIIEGFEIKGDEATSIAITTQGCYDVTPAKVIIRNNWFHGMVGGIDFWGAGGYLPIGWTSGVINTEITGNKFYDMVISGSDQGFGVMIEDPINWATAGDYAVKIENNEFSNLPSNGSNPGVGIVIPRADGLLEAANVYVAGNSFTNNIAIAIAIDGTVGIDVTDTKIINNNFSGATVYGVMAGNIINDSVNAQNNWWGTVSKATISGLVSGSVDFEPYYLDEGGINSSSETLTQVYVGSTYSEGNADSHIFGYDAFATIPEAIAAVDAGGTVNVAAGTYEISSSINVNKSVTIIADTSATIISSALDTPVFNIISDNVTIEKFNITTSLAPFSQAGAVTGNENSGALILINAQNATITNNAIYADESSLGGMTAWTARGITLQTGSATISGNTIYGVRNGIIGRYGVTANIEDNIIFNTKGGIMNYTSSQADADNRIMSNNSWTSTVTGAISHNEWDIVWNTAYYVPDYQQSVIAMSSTNNDAYVVDRRTVDAAYPTDNVKNAAACANLTGNRSHVFVNTTGTSTAGPTNGNINLPYSTIALGVEAVVPGGKVNVAPGTYNESQILIDKPLTLQGAGYATTIIDGGNTALTNPGLVRITADGTVTLSGFTIQNTEAGNKGIGVYVDNSTAVVKILDNAINKLGKAGIVVHTASSAQIEGNIISTTDHSLAPNGIQIGYLEDGGSPNLGITGTIKDNDISGFSWEDYVFENGYDGEGLESGSINWTGAGILITDIAAGLEISNNNIYNNNVGIDIEAGASTKIGENNIIHNNDYGIVLYNADPAINNNKIENNSTGGVFRTTAVSQSGVVNAENNWWGSEDPDFGTLVYGEVSYSPWWVASTGTSSEVPGKPTLVSITTPTKDNTPTLSWNAVSVKPEVKNYSVKISIGEINIENTTDSTTFTPTDALADGDYTWQVKAINSMGESEFSDAGSFTVDTTSISPADLAAGSATINSLALSWTNNEANGSYYIIKRSTSPITAENFDSATTLGGAPIPANGNQGYVVKNLSTDTTYYFAIKLVDTAGNASAIATASGKTLTPATVPTDNTAPGAITDLALQAGSPATSQIKLTWTATGDDGASGFATKYIIKRSTSEITAENFNDATTIYNTLSPKSAGSAETFTVTGLSAGTTYYFAIKVQDEVPNNSAISNVMSLSTLANLPTVSAITPADGQNDGAVAIAVTGTNFVAGANTLRFSNSSNTFEIAATYVDSASLTASAPIGAPIGVYSLKVINSNGTSGALASAYTVKAAPIPLPTVSDIIPANIGSNDSNVSLTIYGTNFTGATAVSIDTALETVLAITSTDSTKIVATIPGMITAGTYNVKVTTAGGTNAISSVKLNVKAPVEISNTTVQDVSTDQPIDLDNTGTIPVQITMQSDNTIVNTDTIATIEVVIPPDTEVKKDDGTAYTGNINPPQVVKTTDEMKATAGEDAIVITMGNPDEKITFSNDFVTTVTLESTNPIAPLIWYYNPVTGLEIAGKDGVKDGVTYVKGGTVLNTVNNNGVYTYTIGLLLDHMSNYVAGVNPSITSVSPSSAKAGETVTITGANFSTSATVKFGATSATVSSLTTTSISVTVPSISAGSYNIVVTNTDGLISNTKAFSVTAASSGGGGGGGFPIWFIQQPEPATPATPATPKVSPATPATPATPAVPGKPAPKVLGEKTYADGTLVRGRDKKIFVIIDGQKKYIANLKELAKYAGQKIYDVENTVLIQYPEVLGAKVLADGMLIRGADGKIYAIKNGQKQYIRSLEELRKSYFGKKIYDVSEETLAKY